MPKKYIVLKKTPIKGIINFIDLKPNVINNPMHIESHEFLEKVKKVHIMTTPKNKKELYFKNKLLPFLNRIAIVNGSIIFNQVPA